ncbi:MAG TPA: hypothetical protein VJA21_18440 [Verrucomicrobiae bacterium]
MPAESEQEEKKAIDPRMHSAEHILTATVMKMFGCARPITTHIEKKKSKADYRFARGLTPSEEQQLQSRVNEVILRDLVVTEEFLKRSEAERTYHLERLPADAGDRVRIVHVGDYDACPCIGPHVRRTSEIGTFRIVSTSFEHETLRVRYKLDPASPTVPLNI